MRVVVGRRRAAGGNGMFSGSIGLHPFLLFCLLPSAFCLLSCSIPNLESPECTESRGALREFYSYHFGNDMKFSEENLKMRERFLAPEFFAGLRTAPDGIDVFTTGTTDFPKAFRIGSCSVRSAERTEIQVLLFWRDDERSEQREIKVEAVKIGDKWLVDKIVRAGSGSDRNPETATN